MLPKYIQEAAKSAAKYHAKARRQQAKIEKWIENKYGESAVNDDGIRDAIIDSIEQSYNPIRAINTIESILSTEFDQCT